MSISVVFAPPEFLGKLTKEVLIDPVVTNCDHVFERLALTDWFIKHNTKQCPVCQREVTKFVPDTHLAKRIQNEFVNQRSENAQHFKVIKQKLQNVYSKVINQPVLPLATSQIRSPQLAQKSNRQGWYIPPNEVDGFHNSIDNQADNYTQGT